MNANKFKVLLCCYTMGIAGCNKTGNPSYIDSASDRKKGKIPGEKESLAVMHGSSTSSKNPSGTSVIDNAIFFAERSLRVSEEKVKRAEENLRIAKEMKDSASSNVQSTVQNTRNINAQFAIKLTDIAKKAAASAENNLRVAEEKVRRTKENIKNAEYALELAKGNKRKA